MAHISLKSDWPPAGPAPTSTAFGPSHFALSVPCQRAQPQFLTLSLGADEASRGVVEGLENTGYGQADVLIAGVEADGGEAQVLQLGGLLRTHLHVGDLEQRKKPFVYRADTSLPMSSSAAEKSAQRLSSFRSASAEQKTLVTSVTCSKLITVP